MIANECEILFVGTLVPEDVDQSNKAFSAAGQMFQKCLVDGLSRVPGIGVSIASVMPIPSYPKHRTLIVASPSRVTDKGGEWRFLPFLNVTPIKQLCVGIALVWSALLWRFRTRRTPSRAVYQYNLTTPPGVFTWISARLTGGLFCVSVNDIDAPGVTGANSIWGRIDFWAQRFLIRRVDKLIVVSESIVADFAEGRPDYLVVEGGVDVARFVEPLRKEGDERSCSSDFRFTYAGALEPINGIEMVLDAFRQLENQNLRLAIAGRGSLEELVLRRASEDSRIEVEGLLTHDQVLRLYERSDALLNIRITQKIDSRYFFPSKMMEYLASGIPVLSTVTGLVKSVYAEFCVLLEQEESSQLARLMEVIATTPKNVMLHRALRGREFVIRERSWQRQGLKIAEYFRT